MEGGEVGEGALARYSELKFARYLSSFGRNPTHVQLIISDLCNQDCSFCLHRVSGHRASSLFWVGSNHNPNRKIPLGKVLEILDDCQEMGVKAIQLTGGGEPTVHPDFQKVVDGVIERGMKYALITNGVLAGKMDLSKASWVRVSLDAATAKTYSLVRRVPEWHFDRACETVRRLRCGVGFVITPENEHEVSFGAHLAMGLGAKYIRITRASHVGGQGWPLDPKAYSKPGFEVVLRHWTDEGTEDPLCGYQRFTTYIGGDQKLYRCCIYSYNPRGLIGDLNGRRFKDVWNGVDWTLDARKCEGCIFRGKNSLISEALQEDESSAFI